MVFLRKVLNDDNDSRETAEGRERFAVRGLLTYVCCLSPRMLTNTARRLALEQAHAALSALFTPCNPCHFVIPLRNRPARELHGSILPLASNPLLGHLCPSVIIPVSKQWLFLPSQHPPFVTQAKDTGQLVDSLPAGSKTIQPPAPHLKRGTPYKLSPRSFEVPY